MNRFKKKAIAAAVGGALGLALTAGQAQAVPALTGCAGPTFCTMQELFDGGSIQMNGIVFSGFTNDFASGMVGSFSSVADFTNIFVTPDDTDPLNLGLVYSGSPLLNSDSSIFSSFFDYSFMVQSTDPLLKLSDADLNIDTEFPTAGAIFDITMDLSPDLAPTSAPFASLNVGDDGLSAQLGDHVDYTPRDSLAVEMFLAAADFGYIDEFSQNFSLTRMQAPPPPTGVPEPTTLALMGIGMAGMGLARRRKDKAKSKS